MTDTTKPSTRDRGQIEHLASGSLRVKVYAGTDPLTGGGVRFLLCGVADVLQRLGRTDEAAAAYRQALDLTCNKAERQFLSERLAELRQPGTP